MTRTKFEKTSLSVHIIPHKFKLIVNGATHFFHGSFTFSLYVVETRLKMGCYTRDNQEKPERNMRNE